MTQQTRFNSQINVAVVGARGYSGLELVRILLKHPNAKVVACFASESGFKMSDYLSETKAASLPVFPIQDWKKVVESTPGPLTFFLATPAEVSMGLAPKLIEAGVNVVDLSGAFRLTPEAAKMWYQITDSALPALSRAQYGLVPFCGPTVGTKLVSNPGCYATAVLMALIPLLKESLIDPTTLVIDAKSGATGAGRKAAENLLFCEVDGECLPYKVGKHQHLPEIEQWAQKFSGQAIDPMFTTHLLPVRRGIIAGIYARTAAPAQQGPDAKFDLARIDAAYAKAYESYPLARWGHITERAAQLSLKRIAGSARVEIAYELKGNRLFVFSLIDNLVKGAAGQAIENFNRINHIPVATGLEELEGQL